MAAPLYEAMMGRPPPPAFNCPDCQKEFPDPDKLYDHMGAQMAKGHGHIHCKECKRFFLEVDQLIKHVKSTHVKPTDLVCPGCMCHFISVGELVQHIERGQCPTISMKKLEEVREKKLGFARELQRRHFGAYDDPDPSAAPGTGSHLRPKAEATVRPNPVQFWTYAKGHLGIDLPSYYGEVKPEKLERQIDSSHARKNQFAKDRRQHNAASLLEDFEPAKHSDLPLSLTEVLTKGLDGLYINPWTDVKSPHDPDWVDDSLQYAVEATSPGGSTAATSTAQNSPLTKETKVLPTHIKLDTPWKTSVPGIDRNPANFAALHDPKKPGWSAKRYLHPVYLQYKCPLPRCFKTFKKVGQFRNHLEWHLQDTPCEYQCPACKRMFNSLSSLLFHTESKSTRCHYRESENYNIFLNQALGGLVDIVGYHSLGPDGRFLEMAVPDQARKDFGPQPRVGRSTEQKMVTAAWEGQKPNGGAKEQKGCHAMPNTPVKVKIEYDEYKVDDVEIDDAFKNLPELGDKVASEPEIEAQISDKADFKTRDEHVFSDDDAPTRVNSQSAFKYEEEGFEKTQVQRKKVARDDRHAKFTPNDHGVSHDEKGQGTDLPESNRTTIEGQNESGFGPTTLRDRDFQKDNHDNFPKKLDNEDLYINGKKYNPAEWIVEWCDGKPLFYPRDPDNYTAHWTPLNR